MQAKPTEKTKATIRQLLDYCVMQEEPIIAYKASKMILAIHSDAGYCNKKNSWSQAGGHFSLSNKDKHPPQQGSNSYHRNNNKSGHVISSGSRIRDTISQRMQGGIFTTNTHWDEQPTTANPDPKQQFDGWGSNQQQNPAQTNQGNEHALPLIMWPWSTKSILYLLAARKDQTCRLFYKTSFSSTPCKRQVRILDQSQRSRRSKTSANETRTDQFQVSKKLNSYKGVLDFLIRMHTGKPN